MLPSPVNGAVKVTGTAVGDIATYTCSEGYLLSGGDATSTCQGDNTWSGRVPTCVARGRILNILLEGAQLMGGPLAKFQTCIKYCINLHISLNIDFCLQGHANTLKSLFVVFTNH